MSQSTFDSILRLLETVLVWPMVGIALLTLFWCKIRDVLVEFAKFISRIKNFKAPGFSVDTSEQSAAATEKADSLFRAPIPPTLGPSPTSELPAKGSPPGIPIRSQLHSEMVQYLRDIPEWKRLNYDGREDMLVDALAMTRIALAFETLYRIIFGSQIEAVIQANRPGGVPRPQLEKLFEKAKADFPELHEERTFDEWLEFMRHAVLLRVMEAAGVPHYAATVRAGEFIKYLIDNGLYLAKFG